MDKVDQAWAAWVEAERVIEIAEKVGGSIRGSALYREAYRRAQAAYFEWEEAIAAAEVGE